MTTSAQKYNYPLLKNSMAHFYRSPVARKTFWYSLASATALTFVLFLAIPLTHFFSVVRDAPVEIAKIDRVLSPSPPLPPPAFSSLPSAKEEEFSFPELEKLPPKLPLKQLELAFELDIGGIEAGDFALAAFSAEVLDDIGLFQIDQLDRGPLPLKRPSPLYPYDLKRNNIEGQVVLRFTIDERGDVSQLRVESSTHRGFEKAALKAVSQWKYQPVTREGKIVKAECRISIPFRLDQAID